MTIRLVLSDDHSMFLDGLASVLAADPQIEIVARAANGIEAISRIKAHQPDVAILDLVMPGANGLEVFVEARRWAPKTRFIVLTGTTKPSMLRQLEQAGVSGLMLKTAPAEELQQTITDVAQGRNVISAAVQQLLDDEPPEGPRLSPREIEVLQAIARGLSNPKIAETLNISPKTVDSHRTSLMAKMNVRSTAMLLIAAMRAGLIDVDNG